MVEQTIATPGWLSFAKLYCGTAWRVAPLLLLTSTITVPTFIHFQLSSGIPSTLIFYAVLLLVATVYGRNRLTRRIAPLAPPLPPLLGSLLAAIGWITTSAIVQLLATPISWSVLTSAYMLWVLALTSIGELFLVRSAKAEKNSA